MKTYRVAVNIEIDDNHEAEIEFSTTLPVKMEKKKLTIGDTVLKLTTECGDTWFSHLWEEQKPGKDHGVHQRVWKLQEVCKR